MHTGIDFGAACGTPVYAPAAGKSSLPAGARPTAAAGGVKISHGVVQGNSLTTIYYHNSSVVVSNGQRVIQGQLIAYSGTTGNSTGLPLRTSRPGSTAQRWTRCACCKRRLPAACRSTGMTPRRDTSRSHRSIQRI